MDKHGYEFHYEDDVTDESVSFDVVPTKRARREETRCGDCGDRDYFLPYELYRHMERMHGERETVEEMVEEEEEEGGDVYCDMCGMDFMNSVHLSYHRIGCQIHLDTLGQLGSRQTDSEKLLVEDNDIGQESEDEESEMDQDDEIVVMEENINVQNILDKYKYITCIRPSRPIRPNKPINP